MIIFTLHQWQNDKNLPNIEKIIWGVASIKWCTEKSQALILPWRYFLEEEEKKLAKITNGNSRKTMVYRNQENAQSRNKHIQNGRKMCGIFYQICPTPYPAWHNLGLEEETAEFTIISFELKGSEETLLSILLFTWELPEGLVSVPPNLNLK